MIPKRNILDHLACTARRSGLWVPTPLRFAGARKCCCCPCAACLNGIYPPQIQSDLTIGGGNPPGKSVNCCSQASGSYVMDYRGIFDRFPISCKHLWQYDGDRVSNCCLSKVTMVLWCWIEHEDEGGPVPAGWFLEVVLFIWFADVHQIAVSFQGGVLQGQPDAGPPPNCQLFSEYDVPFFADGHWFCGEDSGCDPDDSHICKLNIPA